MTTPTPSCTCHVEYFADRHKIEFCPLHAAAEEMYRVVEGLADLDVQSDMLLVEWRQLRKDARAALDRAQPATGPEETLRHLRELQRRGQL